MPLKRQKIYLVTGSLLFLFLPLLFSPHPPEEENFLFSRATQRDFLANLLMLFFFFLNFYVLIPAFYLKKKYLFYGCIIIISLLIVCILPSLITGHNPFSVQNDFLPRVHKTEGHFMPKRPNGFSFIEEIRHHIFLFTAVIFSSAFLREKIRNKIIENEKLQAELSHLKTQIHPHFLFNTLNSIYALSIKKDDKAADTIVKLSEFMRYLLNDSSQDEVILEKEINYIDNYIDLQKSRLRNAVDLQYSTNGDFSNYRIAPLLLFPFIENAFKYGVNPDENSVIKIGIQLDKNHLNMTVFNRKVSVRNIESSKIGLQNTYDRLELYYPKKHYLTIEEDEQTYYANLKIELA
ncbi:sensor histidine kinase [Flavobacterium ajazii]|uniref:sensor histidine kinase n=1 Tax=Flavobacterium ajazii TaxID=2692318 RepID=UPI0013D895CA|nr:histidine kinase [Flavobacterium ajazii]